MDAQEKNVITFIASIILFPKIVRKFKLIRNINFNF